MTLTQNLCYTNRALTNRACDEINKHPASRFFLYLFAHFETRKITRNVLCFLNFWYHTCFFLVPLGKNYYRTFSIQTAKGENFCVDCRKVRSTEILSGFRLFAIYTGKPVGPQYSDRQETCQSSRRELIKIFQINISQFPFWIQCWFSNFSTNKNPSFIK